MINLFQNNHQPIGFKPVSKPIFPFLDNDYIKMF